MVVLNFKAPPELANALRARARAGDRTVSAEIRRALRAHLLSTDSSEAAPAGGFAKTREDGARHAAG